MIKTFKKLGQIELQGLTGSQKNQKFLETQTIIPNEPNKDDENSKKYREIIVNLDTVKEKIEIKLGKELYKKNREVFFGFDLKSANSSKTFFTTNKWYYHLLTIPHLIYYIKKENILNDDNKFLNFLIELEHRFYISDRLETTRRPKKCYININRLIEEQKEIIMHILKEEDKKNILNTKCINYSKLKSPLAQLIKEKIGCSSLTFIKNDNYFLNVFSLKINNKYILETDFKEDYINVVNYILQQRFFDKSDSMVKDNSLCGVCNEKKIVTGQVDIPTKFYVTSSPNFFENLESKNAYKSFGICQDCYQEVMVGISKIEKDFSSKLFNKLRYYIIPEGFKNVTESKNTTKIISSLLSEEQNSFEENIKAIKNIKAKNFKVNFLFWRRDQSSFIVLDSINDVSYNYLKQIFMKLYNLNMRSIYPNQYFKTYRLLFNDIYWLLYPSNKSHKNPDSRLYRKELLSLLSSILKSRELDYLYLIKRFNFILRKIYFKNSKKTKEILYRPMKMNLLLSWLNEITVIKGGYKMTDGNSSVPIENTDIIEYFKTHAATYQNNKYRQGLFLLGVLMNSILKEQKDKSTNIIDKISFEGMSVRRVKKFANDITEMLHIYKQYNDNQILHSQMTDRIQEIESSNLSKDEVVFYILSGISFGRYLGHKYYKPAKNNKKGDDN
ncbi:type I-B CRISPR-associated protein Cas8b/Csh1 [Natronospora cellulosivora (SeqCode)]